MSVLERKISDLESLQAKELAEGEDLRRRLVESEQRASFYERDLRLLREVLAEEEAEKARFALSTEPLPVSVNEAVQTVAMGFTHDWTEDQLRAESAVQFPHVTINERGTEKPFNYMLKNKMIEMIRKGSRGIPTVYRTIQKPALSHLLED